MTNVNVEIGDMGSVLAMAERTRMERRNHETVAAILAWVLSEGCIEHRLRAADLLVTMGSRAAPAVPAILTCLAGAEELPTLSADDREVCLLCVEALDDVSGRAWAYTKDGYLCETGAVSMEPQWKMSGRLLEYSGLSDKSHYPDRSRLAFWRKDRWNIITVGTLADQLRFLPDTLRFRGIPAAAIPGSAGDGRNSGSLRQFHRVGAGGGGRGAGSGGSAASWSTRRRTRPH